MIYIGTNIQTFEVKTATTLTGLARQLDITYKQLSKFTNKSKLFQKKWIISASEPIKSKSKGRKF